MKKSFRKVVIASAVILSAMAFQPHEVKAFDFGGGFSSSSFGSSFSASDYAPISSNSSSSLSNISTSDYRPISTPSVSESVSNVSSSDYRPISTPSVSESVSNVSSSDYRPISTPSVSESVSNVSSSDYRPISTPSVSESVSDVSSSDYRPISTPSVSESASNVSSNDYQPISTPSVSESASNVSSSDYRPINTPSVSEDASNIKPSDYKPISDSSVSASDSLADSVDYKAIAGKDDTVTTDSLAKKGKDDALKMADSKVDQSTTDALGAVDVTEKALESANAGTQKASTGSSRYNLAVSPEVETALDSLSEEHRNQFIKALKDYGYGLNNSETSATTTPEYTLSSTSSSNKGKLDFTPYGQSTLTDSQGQPTSAYQDLLDLANSKESQPLFNQSASNDYQIKKGDSLAKIGNLHYPDDKEKAAAASMLALQDLHGQNKLNINNKQNRINLTPGDKVNVDLSNYTSEEISALAKGFNKIQSAENKIDTFRQAQEEAKALARAQERQNRASQVRQTRTEARNLSQDQAKQNYTHLTQQATQKSQSSNYSPLYISPLFNLNKGNKVQTVIPYRIGAKSYIPKNSSPVSGGVSDFQNRKGLIDRINNLVNNLPHVSKSISNGAREFGEKLMDNGAREENFVKYIVGRGSVASGEVLDSSSAAIKRMADNPGAALSGILKGVVNSVADVPNTGINLGKTIIDGWTLIPEELPFIQRGALQSFRDSTPYNFPRPLEYSSKAEEDYSIFSPGVLAKGAKLLTKGASALGVTKMTSGVRAAKDLSVTEVTRKSPFAEVAKLEQKGHQSALTEKVLNNIADSARARDASNFSTYARTERILNNIADSANARRASNFYPHIGREKRIDTHRYDLWNRHVNKGLEPSDRAKLTQWSQLLEPEFYLENKKVFDNPDYFNQLTGNAIYPGTPESALGRVDGSIHKDGFLNGEYKESVILPGTRINRIGSNPTGRYFSPAGATFGEKALPPFMKLQPDSDYISLKKIPIREGLVAPWFDEPGMGIQYYTYLPMRELEKGGYLHKIKKE
ncbi:Uncharacterised protein [Streptococcus sanguinis]|uniref:TNT domain-containing protein n=1 Tax=Streptococcus sanguinis TaxID=1305 RepID=A0A2X3VE90_STRSA|nr:TNT domain-containing protein [Streptococcus sanguinis]SQF35805.1 Uncharacterised protein [Streptococcus sanguinis]